MRALVTGGAGFIGSHVVDRLTAAGVRPRIFDLVRSPHHRDGDAETVLGDLLDPSALRAAMHGCEVVVHLAALADADAVPRRPADAERVNGQGTLNVLDAAREAGIRRVIYASTIWVYSDVDARCVDEDTLLAPPAHIYTATKLAGEMYCRSYAELYGLEHTILRFGIPYGPRARSTAVIPTFVHKALTAQPLMLAGGGGQSRRFVYVEDLADGVVRALRPGAANRTYNLVGAEDVTIREVAETVRRAVGEVEIVTGSGRNADFRGIEVCGERAASELGWRPSTTFSEGVQKYVAWHRAQDHVGNAGTSSDVRRRSAVLDGFDRWLGIIGRAAPAALVVGIAAMLVLFFEALGHAGAQADEMRTLAITSLVGLTLYAALSSDPDSDPRPLSGLARLGWLAAGAVLAIAVSGPYDPLRLVHSDVELLVLSTIGAGLGVGTGAAGRRLLRERLLERPSDTGG